MPSGWANGTDGWATVPAGYPNDSYPIGYASTGEKFAVAQAGSGSNSSSGGSGDMIAALMVKLDLLPGTIARAIRQNAKYASR